MTPSWRRLNPRLHASALMVFVALVLAGIGQSLLTEGRFPQIHFGYADRHLALLRAESGTLSQFRTAAMLDFDNPEAQSQFLLAAYQAGDAELAAEAVRGLLRLNPRDSELHARLAGLLLDLGEWEAALVHSSIAIQLEPNSADYQCLHGSALLSGARLQDAAAAFRRALQIDPQSLQARQALAHPLKGH